MTRQVKKEYRRLTTASSKSGFFYKGKISCAEEGAFAETRRNGTWRRTRILRSVYHWRIDTGTRAAIYLMMEDKDATEWW
jgi:hypothetical protein